MTCLYTVYYWEKNKLLTLSVPILLENNACRISLKVIITPSDDYSSKSCSSQIAVTGCDIALWFKNRALDSEGKTHYFKIYTEKPAFRVI